MDPTAGSGTTLVESVVRGRNAAGVEVQTSSLIEANISHAIKVVPSKYPPGKSIVIPGDARNLTKMLADYEVPPVHLVINNPPYSGDESQKGMGAKNYEYDRSKSNLAFLKEGIEYYDVMTYVYSSCVNHLVPGGYLVIG
ncbi:hypothetical protein, partial [Escherichia coli]|uniref:hypothetical protein n=1 Tax=Escherichia coli TaxID=562 RepID=UPI0022FE1FBC